MKSLGIALVVVIMSISVSATAQTKLNLPTDYAEMRKYMRDYDNYCPTCAVVTNVRPLDSEGSEIEFSGVAGPEDIAGNNVLIQPIFSSNKVSTRVGSASKWRITVRYDNGSYAAFEQLQKPEVMKGDTVQVIEGRVERR